jgi:hypothetical protein
VLRGKLTRIEASKRPGGEFTCVPHICHTQYGSAAAWVTRCSTLALLLARAQCGSCAKTSHSKVRLIGPPGCVCFEGGGGGRGGHETQSLRTRVKSPTRMESGGQRACCYSQQGICMSGRVRVDQHWQPYSPHARFLCDVCVALQSSSPQKRPPCLTQRSAATGSSLEPSRKWICHSCGSCQHWNLMTLLSLGG